MATPSTMNVRRWLQTVSNSNPFMTSDRSTSNDAPSVARMRARRATTRSASDRLGGLHLGAGTTPDGPSRIHTLNDLPVLDDRRAGDEHVSKAAAWNGTG